MEKMKYEVTMYQELSYHELNCYDNWIKKSWHILTQVIFPSDTSLLAQRFCIRLRIGEEEMASLYVAFEPIVLIPNILTMLWYYKRT